MRTQASRHRQQLRQQQLRNHRKHRLLRHLAQRQRQMRQQYLSILRHLRDANNGTATTGAQPDRTS